ncbi:FliC/FljB family flagellin [Glaciimonas soli]|uniref:Flagellin n=1 Tax=Glaciimonas soli TaxID=2590999 RepID=A0A843YKF5_9BURK|nr:FliC/FljB family flagellin [Glaciimonas soli]MQQ99439.1 FliC/FljB family flagellin [Glaciimonas soli]
MAQIINTNVLSLTTQNNLNKSQAALGSAIERLSSGQRINSAKDDAAGMAIASRFTSNIKGLEMAKRNANDGISIAQTTEGALTEITNNVQRVRELTVQAATGTNSATDLRSIQKEINQRLAEIDRTAAQTDFNGVKVLGSDQKLTIQVGANDGETIEVSLRELNAKTLGLEGLSVASPKGAITALADGDLKDSTGADIKAGAVTPTITIDGGTAVAGAAVMKDSEGSMFIEVTVGADKKYYGVSKSDFKTTDETAVGNGDGTATIDIKATSLDMLAATKTTDPLAKIDSGLKQVNDLRADLGAVQNRFDSVIANLGTAVVNLSASRSRIEDADMAVEVSNMTRSQILQQAGTSVLSQANKTTQNVLSLLQ